MKYALLLCGLLWSALALPGQTGSTSPEFQLLDQVMPVLRAQYDLPGLALAIAKDGRLVYARGFGLADRATDEPVQPDSLFRVASVSKPITAIAVLKLIEDGKLTLDTRVLALLGRQAAADPRYADITVRHLLQHSGGLDIETWGFDPSFPDRETIEQLGANLPPSRAAVLDFILENLPLAFAPGTRYAYSNVGFMLLTEVIEKAAGQPYERFVRERILLPLGIRRMRIGGSLLTQRALGEVAYWDSAELTPSIFPAPLLETTFPYGAFDLRIFESGGGWVAAMPDLVRFLTAFDAGAPNPVLKPETVRLISERPTYVPASATSWYGLGWTILRTPQGERWDHDGGMPGTAAWVVRGRNGVSLAVAANHLPVEKLAEFFNDVQGIFTELTLETPRWPATNLFPVYFPDNRPRLAHSGVVNAASQRPGPVAANSVVTLFGSNLTDAQVLVNGLAVETLWADQDQLNVLVPLTAAGPTRFEVTRAGQSSNAESVPVLPAAPALFTLSRNGYGQAAALNADGTLNSYEQPAAPGSIVVLYATGAATGSVTVAGLETQTLYFGPAPGMAPGILQINIRLPDRLPSGPAPVIIRSGAAFSPSTATIAVR